MQPGSAWLRFGCLRVKVLNRVRRPLRCLDRRLSSPASSSSTRMVMGPGYDCEGANRGKARWLPFSSDRIGRKER